MILQTHLFLWHPEIGHSMEMSPSPRQSSVVLLQTQTVSATACTRKPPNFKFFELIPCALQGFKRLWSSEEEAPLAQGPPSKQKLSFLCWLFSSTGLCFLFCVFICFNLFASLPGYFCVFLICFGCFCGFWFSCFPVVLLSIVPSVNSTQVFCKSNTRTFRKQEKLWPSRRKKVSLQAVL